MQDILKKFDEEFTVVLNTGERVLRCKHLFHTDRHKAIKQFIQAHCLSKSQVEEMLKEMIGEERDVNSFDKNWNNFYKGYNDKIEEIITIAKKYGVNI